MRINNNLMAMNTHRQLGMANTGGAKSMEKLSSGLRINRAGDDAAGLAISEKMRGQIRGLNQASSNAQDGISLIQTTEGALNETHAILQRMRELAVQSSTDTNTDADRANIQDEIDQLSGEITRIAETTQFNTMNLLDGSFEGKRFHIGANEGQDITFNVNNMSSEGLKLVEDFTPAEKTYDKIEGALGGISVKAKNEDIKEIKFDAAENNTTFHVGANKDGVIEIRLATDNAGAVTTTHAELETALKDLGLEVDLGALVGGNAATGGIAGGSLKITKETIVEDPTNIKLGGLQVTDRSGKVVSMKLTENTTGGAGDPVAGGIVIKGTATAIDIEYNNLDEAALKAALEKEGYIVEYLDGKDGTDAVKDTGTIASVKPTVVPERKLDVSTQKAASEAITTVNDALENVSKERSKLGALQNRLEHTIKNLDTSSENLQASEARIRDVDMAKEMMEQTKQNILQQASTAMLAQANQAPQTVLQLLR